MAEERSKPGAAPPSTKGPRRWERFSSLSGKPPGQAGREQSAPSDDASVPTQPSSSRTGSQRDSIGLSSRRSGGRVDRSAASAVKPGVGFAPILVMVGLLAAAGLMLASWRSQSPDPHFLEATKLLRNYELGKDPSELNYEDPTYPAALSELALVDPKSISFDPSVELARDLNAKVLAFRARLKERQAEVETAAHLSEQRDRALSTAQEISTGTDIWASRRVLERGKTECEDEKAGYTKSGKKHDH